MTIISLFLLDYDCKTCGQHIHRTFFSNEERAQSLEFLNRLCYGCMMDLGSENLVKKSIAPRRGRPSKGKK